jgi:hypothetical protein
MLTKLQSLAVVFLIGCSLPLGFGLSTQASIQRLTIEQTAAGPVVHGLFGRFPKPPTVVCYGCKCPTGTKGPALCIVAIPDFQQCLPSMGKCNTTTLESDREGSCSCVCQDVYPPQCTACYTQGSCTVDGKECKH